MAQPRHARGARAIIRRDYISGLDRRSSRRRSAIGFMPLERYFSPARMRARMPKLPEIKPRSRGAAVRGSGHDVKEVAQRPLPLLFIRSPIQSPV